MAVKLPDYMDKAWIERMWQEDEILAEIDQEAEFDYRLKKARKEARIEVAKNMINNNLSIQDIMKYTKLTDEEIEQLREEI